MNFDLGYINKILAISIYFERDSYRMHYHILKKKKGEIIFTKSGKMIADVKALVKETSARIPVVVHFSGKGVLNRSVQHIENYRHSLLMNANLEDFHFTDFNQDDKVYSSVIRKSSVEDVLGELKSKKFQIIAIASGPFIAAPLQPFVDKSSITVNHILLNFEEDKLLSFDRSEENSSATNLGEQMIYHDMLGAVALATNYLNPSKQIILPDENEVEAVDVQEAKQMNVFNRFAMGMMLFFLLFLTANYFYLGHLNSQIEENFVELSEFEDQLAQLSTLEEEKSRKEKLLSGSGLLNKKFLSFYLMEIANSVPKDISLDKVSLRPLMDEIKNRHKIEFQDRLLRVYGKSKSSEILSRWIDRLKKNEWLASVDILDYTYKKNIGNFELEIVLL